MAKHAMFIHGMWGIGWGYDEIVERFKSEGYTCHTPVLRHHDSTTQPNPELGKVSLQDYVHDLTQLIKELDELPVLVGHSMGGLIAQMLAAKGLASALVMVTTATPRGVFATVPSVLFAFSGITSRPFFWSKPNKLSASKYSYAVANCTPEAERAELYQEVGFESGRAVFEIGMWPLDFSKSSVVDFKSVTCPIMMISGESDRITPNVIHKRLAKRYPHALFKTYANHGHRILAEKGEGQVGATQVIQDIVQWLETL